MFAFQAACGNIGAVFDAPQLCKDLQTIAHSGDGFAEFLLSSLRDVQTGLQQSRDAQQALWGRVAAEWNQQPTGGVGW